MVGEPSRRLPTSTSRSAATDFRGDIGRARAARRRPVQRLLARDLGGADQPQRHAARARDRLRVVDRRGRSSSRCPARRSSPTRTTGSSAGSSRAASCSSSRTPTRRPPPTSELLDDPGPRGGAGPRRPRARARRAHLPPPRAAAARAARARRSGGRPWLRSPRPRRARSTRGCIALRRIAIVPALQRGGERSRA